MPALPMILDKRFYAWLGLAFFITFFLHEIGHWLAGTYFGFDMKFSLNGVRIQGAGLPWQKGVMDAMGPLVTIVQGLVAFILVLRTRSQTAYAFLYAAMFMRVVAGLISFILPNDEARLSLLFGWGKWTVPLLVGLLLVALVVKASRLLRLTWKDQALCYLVASLAVTLIVRADSAFTGLTLGAIGP